MALSEQAAREINEKGYRFGEWLVLPTIIERVGPAPVCVLATKGHLFMLRCDGNMMTPHCDSDARLLVSLIQREDHRALVTKQYGK